MKHALFFLAPFSLTGCFPFDEGPRDASKAEIQSMLATCHVTITMMERQSPGADRWLLTMPHQGSGNAEKGECLRREQEKLGADFATFG